MKSIAFTLDSKTYVKLLADFVASLDSTEEVWERRTYNAATDVTWVRLIGVKKEEKDEDA